VPGQKRADKVWKPTANKKKDKDGMCDIRKDTKRRRKDKEIIYQAVFQRNTFSEGEPQWPNYKCLVDLFHPSSLL
jgi:hypothetical protein